MPSAIETVALVLARPAIATDITTLPGGALILLGYNVFNGSTGATTVLLYNGGQATGAPVGTIRVGAQGAQSQWYGPQGIECPGGLSVSGLVNGLVGTILWLPHPGPLPPRMDGGGG